MWHWMPQVSPEEPDGISLSSALDSVAHFGTVAEQTRGRTDDVESEHVDSWKFARRITVRC